MAIPPDAGIILQDLSARLHGPRRPLHAFSIRWGRPMEIACAMVEIRRLLRPGRPVGVRTVRSTARGRSRSRIHPRGRSNGEAGRTDRHLHPHVIDAFVEEAALSEIRNFSVPDTIGTSKMPHAGV